MAEQSPVGFSLFLDETDSQASLATEAGLALCDIRDDARFIDPDQADCQGFPEARTGFVQLKIA